MQPPENISGNFPSRSSPMHCSRSTPSPCGPSLMHLVRQSQYSNGPRILARASARSLHLSLAVCSRCMLRWCQISLPRSLRGQLHGAEGIRPSPAPRYFADVQKRQFQKPSRWRVLFGRCLPVCGLLICDSGDVVSTSWRGGVRLGAVDLQRLLGGISYSGFDERLVQLRRWNFCSLMRWLQWRIRCPRSSVRNSRLSLS
ncbi:hypothetical protein GE09DRAFT_244320 [Coniochaeta sp. 2T2.1]|nr:hypothetical protein GE09DRAFT_244320 [Coniochaeta sp. 2T2.1]